MCTMWLRQSTGVHQGSIAKSSADISGCLSHTVKFHKGHCIMITDHSINGREEDARLKDSQASYVPLLTVKIFFLKTGATEPSHKVRWFTNINK